MWNSITQEACRVSGTLVSCSYSSETVCVDMLIQKACRVSGTLDSCSYSSEQCVTILTCAIAIDSNALATCSFRRYAESVARSFNVLTAVKQCVTMLKCGIASHQRHEQSVAKACRFSGTLVSCSYSSETMCVDMLTQEACRVSGKLVSCSYSSKQCVTILTCAIAIDSNTLET
eukprot:7682-Heterococcus_DN1.PRE.1